MKKIGLIGGLSYLSSIEYYKIINEEVQKSLGGHHSAPIVLYSLDFDPIANAMFNNDWGFVKLELIKAVEYLRASDCTFIAICCNSVHKVFDEVEVESQCKLFHIIEPTINIIARMGLKKVGLLGTKFTMAEKFHEPYLKKYEIDVLTPNIDLHEKINEIIFSEICHERLIKASKRFLLDVAQDLIQKGAEGIILACTELPTVIKSEDLDTILFSTTDIHAKAIAKILMAKSTGIELIA